MFNVDMNIKLNTLIIVSDGKKIKLLIPDKVEIHGIIIDGVAVLEKNKNEQNLIFRKFCEYFLKKYVSLGHKRENIPKIKENFFIYAKKNGFDISESEERDIKEMKISIYKEIIKSSQSQ